MTAGATVDPRDVELERLRAELADARATLSHVLLADIDDRKRVEKRLAASERSLKLSIDATPAMIWSATPDGHTDTVNQHFVDYTGATYEQLEVGLWQVVIHPDDHPGLVAVWNDLLATGSAGQAEARFRRRDGEYRWFLVHAHPLFDESGKIVRWYGVNTDIEDRKRAEHALADSARSLRQTIDTIPAIVFCNSAEGPNEYLSKGWHDYTGIPAEESTGNGWQASLHPDDLPQMMVAWMAMLRGGRGGEIEGRMRRADGIYRRFLFSTAPLRDQEGRIVKWYGTVTDVEDRKQAEAALRRAYDSFADAQRLSHTGSFMTDLVGDDHNWSDEAYRIFEFEPGTDVTIQRVRDIVHPEDLAYFDSVIARGSAGANVDFHFRIVTARGALKHVHGVAHLVDEVVGRSMFVGALQDVTESKIVEGALRRSEAFLAQGEAVSVTGSFLWKLSTGEIRWSDQLYRIFGFELGSPVTLERMGARVHSEDAPRMVDMQRRAHAGLDSEFEHRLSMPDGSVKYLHFVAHSIRGADGELEYMGVVQDISDRKLAEQAHDKVRSELAHAARVMSLGVLTASLAHEVNQPLAGIITNANTCLRMLSADPPNIKGALETARRTIRDGNRASDVVTRLRALFSKKEFVTEGVDLVDAAREVLALSAHELQRHHVSVQTEFESDVLELTGDRVQLQQVILNLVLNACDALKPIEDRPRTVVVRIGRDGMGAAHLSVRDAGVGVAPESLAKLFDPFYTTKANGMGIGLSVSRSIIDRHRGRLWAAQNDGPGATFAFSIPIDANLSAAAQ